MVGKFGHWIISCRENSQIQKLIFGEELQGSPDWWISEIK